MLYSFVGVCMLFAGINLAVDPAHLYGDRAYERKVAELLLRGKAIANLRNYDERLVQRYYVQGLRTAPDVAVFGSSRSMQIRNEAFPGSRAFNHSVSGASLPDFLAIWQLYRERGLRPARLVIGVDPWIFNRNNGQIRWRSLAPEFADISRALGIDIEHQQGASAVRERFRTLFSLPYLVDSLRAIMQSGGDGQTDFFVTEDIGHPDGVRLPDGSAVSPLARRAPDSAKVAADAAAFSKPGNAYSLEGFQRPDSVLQGAFEKFLDLLGEEGIEVTLMLPPYHPLAYQGLLRHGYGVVAGVESHLREQGRRRGIAIRGSYDPALAGCADTDFTDGMHPKAACLSSLLARH